MIPKDISDTITDLFTRLLMHGGPKAWDVDKMKLVAVDLALPNLVAEKIQEMNQLGNGVQELLAYVFADLVMDGIRFRAMLEIKRRDNG